MKFYSPLRYPGGKNKLAKFVASICQNNKIDGHYVEPYAGGASVALFLLLEGYVKRITINDIDRSIYAFWYSVLYRTNELCDLIENTRVNVENWKKLHKIQKNKKVELLLSLGFSTLFLNRTNISGILDAGVIGGLQQNGKYKIDCRFNKIELVRKIRLIANHRNNIRICHLDALELVKKIKKESNNSNTIYYFDPPYYVKGESLYMNSYQPDDHIKVSIKIKEIKNANWIISYDDVESINEMYKGYQKMQYFLTHTARSARKASEVLFFSDNLSIAKVISPINIQT